MASSEVYSEPNDADEDEDDDNGQDEEEDGNRFVLSDIIAIFLFPVGPRSRLDIRRAAVPERHHVDTVLFPLESSFRYSNRSE